MKIARQTARPSRAMTSDGGQRVHLGPDPKRLTVAQHRVEHKAGDRGLHQPGGTFGDQWVKSGSHILHDGGLITA